MRIHLVALVGALALVGCATSLEVPDRQIVMFSGAGNLVDPTGNVDCKKPPADLCQGKHRPFPPYRELDDSSATDYRRRVIADAKARAPEVDGKKRLLLYVHGGLNTQRGTVSRAAGLAPYIPRDVTYPIFVNWQSSFFSTYWDHAVHLRQGQYWKNGGFLAPIWVGSDIVRAVGHAPIDYFYEGKTVYDTLKTSRLSEELEDAKARMPVVPHIRHGEDLRSKKRRAFDFTMQVLFAPPKVVTAPLIDGFGTGAWDSMQHRTTALFQSDDDFTRPGLPLRERGGGLAIFLRELSEMIENDGGREKWSVTLVGHSMGAIVVNRMLDGYANLPVDRIVYLASATSIDDYKRTALAYLQDHDKTEMYHVTLERRAEVFERFNGFLRVILYDAVPRGTLLVWIDNLLSKPTNVLERRVGRYSNLMRDIHDTPVDVAPRVYVMNFDFGPSVRNTQPQRHAAAGTIEFWRQECLFSPVDYPENCIIRERDVDRSAKMGRAMAK